MLIDTKLDYLMEVQEGNWERLNRRVLDLLVLQGLVKANRRGLTAKGRKALATIIHA